MPAFFFSSLVNERVSCSDNSENDDEGGVPGAGGGVPGAGGGVPGAEGGVPEGDVVVGVVIVCNIHNIHNIQSIF
jgi:hypothetical protein